MTAYQDFLQSKIDIAPESGFDISADELNPMLFEWQREVVRWALKKGRAALFEDCGMGKTPQQLVWGERVSRETNMPVLALAPLAVSEQTHREGKKFGIPVTVCRSQNDVRPGVNITNYEMLSHFEPHKFSGIILDESSILKHQSSVMRQEITDAFRETPYKLCCTATPAPNDHMELCNHAEFLGIMSRTEMLSTFFVHDGGDTSKWRLKGHAEEAFWRWLSTWALCITSPTDIGYPDDNYRLPELRIHEHTVSSEIGQEADGQALLFPKVAKTLNERRHARRESLQRRCQLATSIATGNEQCLVWCDLNDESAELSRMIPAIEIRGSDKTEDKASRMLGFASGDVQHLVTKPSIAGFGMNWQNCHKMIFVGLSDSYEMLYQAMRRCWRFGQEYPVDVHLIISEAEGAVKANIDRKEAQAQEMIGQMTRYARSSLDDTLGRRPVNRLDYSPQIEMKIPEWVVA